VGASWKTRVIVRFPKNRKPWNKAKNDHGGVIVRGAHDDGSHGLKCLMGLKPTGGAIAGMAQRAMDWPRPIAGKPSRSVKRHTNWLATINAPATTMSVEKTRKRVLLRVSRSFLDRITTNIKASPMASGTKASRSSGFSTASPLERCDSDVSMLGFSALVDKSHGAACRYAQIHYAGRCRQ